MRLLVTRPRPDAGSQAAKLKALGHEAVVEPLLHIEFLNPRPLPLAGAQALIVTSRNALRALTQMDDFTTALGLPLYAVGGATARLARDLGFAQVHEGGGTAESLVPLMTGDCEPAAGALVHLAGARLAWDLKGALEEAGFEVHQPVLYRTVPSAQMGEEAQEAIKSGGIGGVILMSPETARTYLALIDGHSLAAEAKSPAYFCLSGTVADMLDTLEAARIEVPGKPTEDDLLALIGREAAN